MASTPPGLMAWPIRVVGEIANGADIASIVLRSMEDAGLVPEADDILAVSQKIISKAEGRLRYLDDVVPGEEAHAIAVRTGKDPRIVELVLGESVSVMRAVPGILIVRHRLGFVLANAGIDQSNLGGVDRPGALLLPEDPDRSAAALAARLENIARWKPAILVVDSFGRAWRRGVVGTAIGAFGLTCLEDRRGQRDRNGRPLAVTEVARADALAATAVLLMGEADEGMPLVLLRGAARCPAQSPPPDGGYPYTSGCRGSVPMTGHVVVLTGGVGGAKLVRGMAQIMDPERITAVVNTGDDFRHLGLWISPDIDTLLYTLAGKADPEKGWGRAGESWAFMAAARSLGMEEWFQLGDGDLALHIDRTNRLAQGESLQSITRRHAAAWNAGCAIFPMSDDPAPTLIETDEGVLTFQDYFVRWRCEPAIRAISLAAAARARPLPAVLERLADPMLEAILIAPSNPYLSVDPILAMPALRSALAATAVPVIAVSPLVGGKAVKGPTSKIMAELSIPPTATSIARHYADFLDGMVIDVADTSAPPPIPHLAVDTVMHDDGSKARVAAAALTLAASIMKRANI